MKWTIREVQKQDDAAIEQLIRECLIEFGGNRPGTAWEDPDLGRFSQIYNRPGMRYWVAVDENGGLLAGAGVGPLEGEAGLCELQKMYAKQKARGTGVAHALITTVLDYAAGQYQKCYLETFSNMKAAQKFYAKHGFHPINHPCGHTGHVSCDTFFMLDLCDSHSNTPL